MSPICVQVVVIVTCSQLFFAGAFAAFIPDANDVLNDVDYDITQPNIEQIDENKLFRALSHVVLGYLKSERESLNDYLGQKLEGSMIVYGKSCRNRLHFKCSPFDARHM